MVRCSDQGLVQMQEVTFRMTLNSPCTTTTLLLHFIECSGGVKLNPITSFIPSLIPLYVHAVGV